MSAALNISVVLATGCEWKFGTVFFRDRLAQSRNLNVVFVTTFCGGTESRDKLIGQRPLPESTPFSIETALTEIVEQALKEFHAE